MMVYIHPLKFVSGVNFSSLSKALSEVSCNKSLASSLSAVNLNAKRNNSVCILSKCCVKSTVFILIYF